MKARLNLTVQDSNQEAQSKSSLSLCQWDVKVRVNHSIFLQLNHPHRTSTCSTQNQKGTMQCARGSYSIHGQLAHFGHQPRTGSSILALQYRCIKLLPQFLPKRYPLLVNHFLSGLQWANFLLCYEIVVILTRRTRSLQRVKDIKGLVLKWSSKCTQNGYNN